MPAFGRELTETERLYLHQSSEKAAKKAEGLAKLAQWKQDNPELVEAQKQLAKIKRRKGGLADGSERRRRDTEARSGSCATRL
jgi:hypothetical protein